MGPAVLLLLANGIGRRISPAIVPSAPWGCTTHENHICIPFLRFAIDCVLLCILMISLYMLCLSRRDDYIAAIGAKSLDVVRRTQVQPPIALPFHSALFLVV
jgi:hypothetical protein